MHAGAETNHRAALLIIGVLLTGAACPASADAEDPAPTASTAGPPDEKDICGVPLKSERGGELVSHTTFTRCTYPPNLACQWDLESGLDDKQARIKFSFDAYEIPKENTCQANYLNFVDGHSESGTVIKSLCTGRTLPEPFNSTGDKVRVVFKAGNLGARGFKLKWNLFRVCQPGDFKCGNGECVDIDSKCDGGTKVFLKDCTDGSDDAGCPLLTSCPPKQLLCGHRMRCYKEEFKCDGVKDCRDGSDENDCPDLKCKVNEHLCSHKKKCYSETQRCNGKNDCRDNSDEKSCKPVTCKAGEFRCNHTYGCAAMGYKCDAVEDCSDGSDEWGCPKSVTCDGTKQFACDNGMVCIDKELKCNGVNECRSDGSDEKGCKEEVCAPDSTKCGNQLRCIKMSQVCDGKKDCPDNSDEDKCKSDGTKCSAMQFQCKKRLAACLDRSMVCDKKNDCMDNSDEQGCLYPGDVGPPCVVNHLWCGKAKKCIRATQACDGKDDCGDNYDEADCFEDVCKVNWFRCDNRQYINSAKICARSVKCNDGSDSRLACPAQTG